ncbi:MAG: radical SAM protein [Candidatus Omnitrophota bacterium]
MDRYKIDSHKLMYHVSRVHKWNNGDVTYPIYMELSPAGSCNHRCTYCGLDFMGYKPRQLDTVLLKERLLELGELGIKSIMYAGEGEPFLHKDMPEIIRYTRESGIDAAVTTNAVFFENKIAEDVVRDSKWIKVSINGATRQTYSRIHSCGQEDFNKVIKNMSYAAEIREKNNYSCALGMQLLLLPENQHEAADLAELAAEIGMDYLVIKPYSQHPQSKTTIYESIKYNDYAYLEDELAHFNTDKFSVIFRTRTMKKWDQKTHDYKACLALPFWSYIDASGNVWGCSMYLGNKNFLYGNIYEETFKEIWEGEKRRKSLHWVEKELDVAQCRVNCRMDEINRYLWTLKNPLEHVNFI